MLKVLAIQRPGAIAAIAAVWLVSRTPLAPHRAALLETPDPRLPTFS